ncbi:MAG: pantoate--beta-alanine ligase [Actinomycetota bacterium]
MQGHASLIEAAKSLSDYVLVSVFVNPLQFEDAKDLENYPRSPDTDREIAKNAGASAVWFPSVQEIFGEDLEPISAGKIGDLYEGAARAGHFSGMLTAVNQLFQLVKPTYAIFGEKDFQQLFLIKNMVKESGLPIKIIGAPTIRESDGLAMSSRNIRLNSVGRDAALVISRALFAAAKESSLSDQKRLLVQILDSEPNFRLDYAVIIDEETFSPAVEETIHKRALVAGWVNGVRLIDNISMGKFNG